MDKTWIKIILWAHCLDPNNQLLNPVTPTGAICKIANHGIQRL